MPSFVVQEPVDQCVDILVRGKQPDAPRDPPTDTIETAPNSRCLCAREHARADEFERPRLRKADVKGPETKIDVN